MRPSIAQVTRRAAGAGPGRRSARGPARRAAHRGPAGAGHRAVRPRRGGPGGDRPGLGAGVPAAQAGAARRRPPAQLPPSRLRVAWLDRRAGVFGNQVLGTYVAVAPDAPAAAGAAAEPGRVAADAVRARRGQARRRGAGPARSTPARSSGTGLVLMAYRSIPAHGARSGSAGATRRSRSCGWATPRTPRRPASRSAPSTGSCSASSPTPSAPRSPTPRGGSYTSTVGTADSVADSVSSARPQGRSRGRGRSRQDAFAPFGALHRVGEPGFQLLARHLGLAVDHRGHQREHVLGTEHVPGGRRQRVAGQDRAAVPRVPGRAA